MAEDGRLTRRQENAIAALLSAPTLAEAAHQAGVGERTLFRWLSEDARFRDTYRNVRRSAMDQAIARLQQASSEAVDVLRSIMVGEGHQAAARVTAARSILEFALRGIELEDLAARVEALELGLEEMGRDE